MSDDAGKPRVLLVEDEAMIAMELQSTLERAGWEVVGPAGRLRQALRAASETELDVALLDANLWGESSAPVAEVLLGRGIPFMFLTGYGPGTVPERLRVHPVLTKPHRGAVVLAALAVASRRAPAPPRKSSCPRAKRSPDKDLTP